MMIYQHEKRLSSLARVSGNSGLFTPKILSFFNELEN
jgi:hypothetical protein